MTIIVDTHENRSKLPPILESIGVPLDFAPLQIGDYIISGPSITICAESKTAEDYVGSINNKQLSQELYQMSCNYKKSLLMIHGSIDDALMKRKVTRKSYFEYLAGCFIEQSDQGLSGAISIINFERTYDAANFLKTVHNKVMNDDIIRHPEAKKFKITEEKRKKWAIQTFHRLVGDIRATALFNTFDTIKDIVNASQEELEEVDGIGEKISKEMWDFFNK